MTGNMKRERILCMDDEPALLDAYKYILEPHGYEVVTALDSIEALRIMLREPVDLLIQDLARPAVNGFELYAMLRANERLKNIPVVICSGHGESRRKFLDRYPDVAAVLVKPVIAEALLDTVRKALPSVAGECGEEELQLQLKRRQTAEGYEWRARWKAGENVLHTTDWYKTTDEAEGAANEWMKAGVSQGIEEKPDTISELLRMKREAEAGGGKPPRHPAASPTTPQSIEKPHGIRELFQSGAKTEATAAAANPPTPPPMATPTREPEKPQNPRQMLTGSMKRLRGWAIVAVVLAAAGGYYTLTHRKVCGYVANVHFSARTRGQPTFLDLGQPYPNQDFTIVIWKSDLSRFPGSPDDLYLGKNICVNGPIVKYRGRPEIIVHNPSQIITR